MRGAAASAALVLLPAGCSAASGAASAGSSGSGTGFVSASGAVTAIPADRRLPAPDLSGRGLDGKPLRLSDFRGKVVLLNVWGSWCAPCRAEAPGLERTFESTRAKGVQFLGINTRDLDAAPALAFERRFAVTYPSFHDPEGALVLRFKGDLMPQAIPNTLVIDRRGRIAARAFTPLPEEDVRALLAPVIAEGD